MHLVAQDVFEDFGLAVDERVDHDLLRLVVLGLVDDPHDRLRRELVSAEMREMRTEPRRDEGEAVRQAGRFEKPSDEERAVRARRERDGVQDDGGCHALDLKARCVGILQGLAGAARAEAARSNLPDPVDHGVEDEIGVQSSEAESALDDVVSKVVEEERRRVGSQALLDERELVLVLGALDDLLDSPRAVLVRSVGETAGQDCAHAMDPKGNIPDGGEVRCNAFKHRFADRRRRELEQLHERSISFFSQSLK